MVLSFLRSCVFWDYSNSAWSTVGCTTKSDEGDFVECQCDHLTNFAAQGESDDRAGYSIAFYVICSVCAGAFFVAIFIHPACPVENLFAAKLLMHLFFACMMSQLMFVFGAGLVEQQNDTVCSVLAMFIHYFFLCQFSWMFIEAWNIWRVFVLNDEHTDRKLKTFFVLGWGMPVLIIVLYILIAQLALEWKFTEAYADVHSNGDMCFIPNTIAALASVVAPVVLYLMAVGLVFTQAYLVTPQWKNYDDIFRGRYNIRELPYIIFLFGLITLVWLCAGFHLAYGDERILITFMVLDGILALYVLIWYLWRRCRGPFKQSFAIPSVSPPIELRDDLFRDSPGSPGPSISSLKRSGMRNSPDDPTDWDDLDYGATPKGSRKMLVNMDDTESLGRVNEMYEDDDFENQDVDDLVFALKTGGQYDQTPDDEKVPEMDVDGHRFEHFEPRRISIADTHL